jgi:hypothetical protein
MIGRGVPAFEDVAPQQRNIFAFIRSEPQPTLSVGKHSKLAIWLGDEFRFPHDLDGPCSIFVAFHHAPHFEATKIGRFLPWQ